MLHRKIGKYKTKVNDEITGMIQKYNAQYIRNSDWDRMIEKCKVKYVRNMVEYKICKV